MKYPDDKLRKCIFDCPLEDRASLRRNRVINKMKIYLQIYSRISVELSWFQGRVETLSPCSNSFIWMFINPSSINLLNFHTIYTNVI